MIEISKWPPLDKVINANARQACEKDLKNEQKFMILRTKN